MVAVVCEKKLQHKQVNAVRSKRGHINCYCTHNSQRREHKVERGTTRYSVSLARECSFDFFLFVLCEKEDGEEINQENKTNVSEIAWPCGWACVPVDGWKMERVKYRQKAIRRPFAGCRKNKMEFAWGFRKMGQASRASIASDSASWLHIDMHVTEPSRLHSNNFCTC